MEGNLRFKIDWASPIVGSKFTVVALVYFVCESNFLSTSPWGAYISRADLTEGFSRYRFGGLIFGGAYTRRAYFRNFTVLTLWIGGYVVSEYPRIHLSLGAALKWQGILQLSRFCTT